MRSQYKDSQFVLTVNQVNQLINATTNLRNKLIISSAYYPALRRVEICNFKVENIDFAQNIITILGKRNKIAPIPVGCLYPQYMQDLKYYLEFNKRKNGYIFSTDGKKPISEGRINQIFHETAKLARLTHPNKKTKKTKFGENVRQINPHLLRHSQARHLKDLGFSAEFIKNYLRHDSIEMTMDMYGTMGIEDMKRYALEKTGRNSEVLRL